jgi:hypothetical protein
VPADRQSAAAATSWSAVPGRIENDNFVDVRATGLAPGDDLAELGVHLGAGHHSGRQRVMQVAGRGALLRDVGHQLAAPSSLFHRNSRQIEPARRCRH